MAAKKKPSQKMNGSMMSKQERIEKINEISKAMVDEVTGSSILRTMSEIDSEVRVYSTRVPSLDIAIGVGGIPRGRITEFYGSERGGKSTLALQIAATCQSENGIVLYIDTEHALDPKYCASLGVDLNDPGFYVVQEESADRALDAAIKLITQGMVDLVVIDSLANLLPDVTKQKIDEQGVGASSVATKAQLQTKFIESIISAVNLHKVALVNVQQQRAMSAGGGAMPLPGSATQALSVKHNTSLRIKVARTKDNTGDGNKSDSSYVGVSQETLAKIEKNKVAPPFRQALYTIKYGEGVLYWEDLLECCIARNMPYVSLVSNGRMYEIIDPDTGEVYPKFYKKSGEGSVQFFKDNPEIGCKLVDKLSDIVCIHLWDPIRGSVDRRIGPYSQEEIEELGSPVHSFLAEPEMMMTANDDSSPIEEIFSL